MGLDADMSVLPARAACGALTLGIFELSAFVSANNVHPKAVGMLGKSGAAPKASGRGSMEMPEKEHGLIPPSRNRQDRSDNPVLG